MSAKRESTSKKLFDLKGWLDLGEAAQHISKLSGEEVNAADVLKFALNGHLKLSVKINRHNIAAKRCRKGIEDVGIPPVLGSSEYSSWVGSRLEPEDEICHLNEQFYDIPMIGAEKSVVYNKWEEMKGSPAQDWLFADETVLQDKDGELYILHSLYFKDEFIGLEHDEYRPANGLPYGSEFVVLTEAVSSFARKYLGYEAENGKRVNESRLGIDIGIDETPASSSNAGERPQLSENKNVLSLSTKKEDSETEKVASEDVDVETLNMFGIPRQRYLNIKEIIGDKKAGIPPIVNASRSTWLGWVQTGYAPGRVKLSDGTTVWKTLEVAKFLLEREQESRAKK